VAEFTCLSNLATLIGGTQHQITLILEGLVVRDACFTSKHGKEIFELNFSYEDISEAVPLIEECATQIRQRSENSVLTLTTVAEGKFNAELVEKLKGLTKGNSPYVRKAAVVGITGVYKIVMTAVNIFSKRDFKLFDNKEDAIKYLLQD
jgi:hypothetical protein